MVHIVVLGAGIAGIPFAYEMREKLKKGEKITVVSNSDSFSFTPSNPWVGVGWRKKDDITVPLPPLFAHKRNMHFTSVGAKRLHPEKNQLELNDGTVLDYDYLCIATGPDLAFDEIEGFGPKAFTQSVCTTDHAVHSHDAWKHFVKDPGPIVVGAVQGASCFGPAYEYALIMETDLRRRRIRSKVPMTFVTSEPYVGHLGLGGVGDTKGLLESALRDRHIKWICNAKVDRFEAGKVFVTECDDEGKPKKTHELPFKYSMFLPAFRGIEAVRGIEGLTNPRGFILVDKNQRNPKYQNIFSAGVCIAIPPVEPTPVPTGCPKTGYMIESMVTASVHNIRDLIDGNKPTHEGSWSAICLADFGDTGTAMVAIPQIPPRNVSWTGSGKWVHLAKIAFEKYFLRKVKKGVSEPIYEKYVLKAMGLTRLMGGGTEGH